MVITRMRWISQLFSPQPLLKVIFSIAVVLLAVGLRTVLVRAFTQHIPRPEVRRRWIVTTQNLLALLVAASLASIWAEAVRTLTVSLAAIAVAVVLTTKEILQSMLASALKAVTNPFSVGDRIVIGSYRGDVIDQTPFSTTILEVGPGQAFHMRTGRKITFPNNKLLDSFIINESYTGQYVVHVFSVPLRLDQDWKRAEEILLRVTREECAPFLEAARESMNELERKYGLEVLPVEPRVSIQITDPDRLQLLVRYPAPVGRQGRIEQAIIHRFLEEWVPKSSVVESQARNPGTQSFD